MTATLAQTDPTHAMLMTMAWAISAGALLVVAARKLNLPAIVVLLLGGFALGPAVLGYVNPEAIGDGLRVIVSLSVGLILFEGGLTLDVRGYKEVPAMIKRLLSIGVITTWSLTAAAAHFIIGVPWDQAIIAGSLVIVTGPTVIAPLLKRIRLNTRLHNILHWEGVLIDPIGVFIVLLCFEWLVAGGGERALLAFAVRIGWGLLVGAIGGIVIMFVVRKKWVPEETVNIFALGAAVLLFGFAEVVQHEAGLLTVTVAGLVVGFAGGSQLKQIRQFKAELTDLLIGTLFILLAARLSLSQFENFGWEGVIVVAIVMFVVRPVGVFLCSLGTDLTWREKIYLSWVAPRGIVAASMASLIAINLEHAGRDNPKMVETFTYSVIVSTVILQGFSAGPLARLLKLLRPVPTGWMLVGAHALGRRAAMFLKERGERDVLLIDTNVRHVNDAQSEGLQALTADARDAAALMERGGFEGVGKVLALTDNEDLNARVCQNWAEFVGKTNVFRYAREDGVTKPNADHDAIAGKAVWTKVPKPSLVSTEVDRAEAALVETTGDVPAQGQNTIPLLRIIDNRIAFDPPAALEDETDEAHTLYLYRRSDYLLRSLRLELITPLKATNLEDLLAKMIDLVLTVAPKVPREETARELIERETTFPTALGHGVAVPHTYSSALDSRLCAVAQLPEGIDINAPDGEPIRLAFLLLSPTGDPEGHLATLAEIARLVIDPQVRNKLIHASSPMEFQTIVRHAMRR